MSYRDIAEKHTLDSDLLPILQEVEQEALRDAAHRTAELKRQLEHFKWIALHASVTEIAACNSQVSEYCRHWEARAESAERKVEELRTIAQLFLRLVPVAPRTPEQEVIYQKLALLAGEGDGDNGNR